MTTTSNSLVTQIRCCLCCLPHQPTTGEEIGKARRLHTAHHEDHPEQGSFHYWASPKRKNKGLLHTKLAMGETSGVAAHTCADATP
jgi:hypothetical protein